MNTLQSMTNGLVIDSLLDLNFPKTFLRLHGFLGNCPVYVKLEALNPAGSIKIKPALEMIESLERDKQIVAGKSHIIESSSGNLGIALALVCKLKGYDFTCVSDPNINAATRRLIQLYGAKLIVIDKPDKNGGYLGSRIEFINTMLKKYPHYVWTNQYASGANKRAHYEKTAAEIFDVFPKVDYLFVGTGTSGTLMGCIEYVRDHKLSTKIIAVDALGSVTFGFPPRKRRIPGLGTSRRPEILQSALVDEVMVISEQDTIRICHELLSEHCMLAGGSTGTVMAAVRAWEDRFQPHDTVVAISPDAGERYVETVYNPRWIAEHFAEHFAQPEPRATIGPDFWQAEA